MPYLVSESLSGHRLHYLNVILEGSTEHSRLTVAVSADNSQRELATIAKMCADYGVRLRRLDIAARDHVAWAQYASQLEAPVVALQLDNLVRPLRKCPVRTPLSGLIMRPWGMGGLSPRSLAMQVVKKQLVHHLIRKEKIRKVALLRQSSVTFQGMEPPIYEVADPIYADSKAERKQTTAECSEDVVTVGMFGEIGRRKRPLTVAQAVSRLNGMGQQRWRFDVHGRVPTDVKRRLEQYIRAGIVTVDDRWLTDKELRSSIAASDIVACVQRTPAASGMVGMAVAEGTPVVLAGRGEAARYVESTGTGVVAPFHTARRVAKALDSARRQRADYVRNARRQAPTISSSSGQFAARLLGFLAD